MASIPIKKISDEAEKICKNHDAYLYDIQFIKEGKDKVLRIFVDKPGGIGIDLCETISREISAYLDETNPIESAYSLEVSSPGAERKLRTLRHYEMVLGKKINISLYAPENGEKNLTGILEKADENEITINTNNESITLSFEKIANASLYFDVQEFLKSQSK